jgi:hypothetical protein
MADWVTISSLATAGGTLVLAIATFGSVRSANRAARVAEQAMLAGQRPLLIDSHLDDASQKVSFVDEKWLHVPGGGAAAEASAEAVYLAISLRNVGNGIAVLHGWQLATDGRRSAPDGPPPLESFHRLIRDLYIQAGDIGFWQGAFRDPGADEFAQVSDAIGERRHLTVFILYGDQEGGQRVISMFGMDPRDDGAYIATIGRHWHLDRPDPR